MLTAQSIKDFLGGDTMLSIDHYDHYVVFLVYVCYVVMYVVCGYTVD